METVSVGKIVATHGLRGEMILEHGLGHKTSVQALKVIFIEEKGGSRIPYFVTEVKGRTVNEASLLLEGIATREQAQKLLQKKVWFKQEDFEKMVSPQSTIALIGYTIIENKQKLGEISEIIEQPHQVLCTIIINEKEVLIPLHEETLQKIDRRKKEVHVQLPEGLLDIYLA